MFELCAYLVPDARCRGSRPDDMQDDAAAQIAETAEEHAGAMTNRLPGEIECRVRREERPKTKANVGRGRTGARGPATRSMAEEPAARDTGDFADAGAPEEGAEDKGRQTGPQTGPQTGTPSMTKRGRTRR